MKRARFSTRSFVVMATCFTGSVVGLGGCNDAQAGALLGAGIGALAGQAIGHDTGSTVIGTAVGAGAGYVIGNESDKAKHRHYDRYDGRP